MKPVRRYGVNKHKSAKSFRKSAGRSKMVNFAAPMRGGIRL